MLEDDMENTIFNKLIKRSTKSRSKNKNVNNLSKASINVEYNIKRIETTDKEMVNFLFTLGCYEGETVTVISKLADNFVISVKDARYSIDTDLAKAINI